MMDESQTPGNSSEAQSGPGMAGSGTPAAYCQECGRPLAANALQRVGNGIFCAPCATHRQAAPGWQAVNAGTYGAGSSIRGATNSGDPNPVFAGVLGFIPGVGAMYNGQYAKGALHLVVFVVLVTTADNLNWVFYWFVWGWVFYQAFDAYHTARARRDGVPLPNPFGWNDIGDRFGAYRANLTATPIPPPPPRPADFAETGSARASADWARYTPPAEPVTPRYAAYAEPPRPTGDNPYTAPYTTPAPPPPPSGVPPAAPFMTSVPYAPTYTGSGVDQAAVTNVPTSANRFPVGALWLIGLGLLFLVGNLSPGWRLSGRWLTPVLLAALAAWSAIRRWEQFRVASLTVGGRPNFASAMSWPVILFTVAGLLALQSVGLAGLHRSWPVLLVVWGLLQAAQRATSPAAIPLQPDPAMDAANAPVRSASGTGHLGL